MPEKMKIAIWGTHLDGRSFYYQNRNRFDIVCFIESKQPQHDSLFNLPVLSFAEFEKRYFGQGIMMVIATSRYFDEIHQSLQKDGYRLGIDYVHYFHWFKPHSINYMLLRNHLSEEEAIQQIRKLLESDGKGLAVVYGTCQMWNISTLLQNCKEFYDRYLLLEFRPYWEMESSKSLALMTEKFWQMCDLFVYANIGGLCLDGILGKSVVQELLTCYVPDTCQKIQVPRFSFYGYSPQVRIPNRYNVDVEYDVYHNGRFPYGDRFIDRLAKKGKSADEIVKTLLDPSFLSKEEAQDAVERAFLELEIAERQYNCDVSISDYVKEHYQERQLYFCPTHPAEEVLKEVAQRIIRKLLKDDSMQTKFEVNSNFSGFESFHTIVYPCVQKGLQLKNCFSIYNANKNFWDFSADAEGFIRKYLEVCWSIT